MNIATVFATESQRHGAVSGEQWGTSIPVAGSSENISVSTSASPRLRGMVFILALGALLLLATAGFAAEGGEGAHHAGGAAQLKDFGWRVFNFIALAAIIGWALGKANVKGALAERSARIEKNLKEASEARAAAEARLQECNARIDQAAGEIEEMYAAIVREAEQEKERIVAEAHRVAEKIAAQAALSAEQEVLKARAALQAEAGRLAVDLAEGKLTDLVTRADHDRFIADYLDKVERLP